LLTSLTTQSRLSSRTGHRRARPESTARRRRCLGRNDSTRRSSESDAAKPSRRRRTECKGSTRCALPLHLPRACSRALTESLSPDSILIIADNCFRINNVCGHCYGSADSCSTIRRIMSRISTSRSTRTTASMHSAKGQGSLSTSWLPPALFVREQHALGG
jgi:hypothetical protein